MAEAAKAPNSLSGVTTLTLDIFGIRCMMGQPEADEGGDQVTSVDRKREIFAQPSAAKEVYAPEDHYINSIIGIVRGPDGLWHLFYEPAYPGGPLGLPSAGKSSSFDHAPSNDRLTWT